MFTCWAAVYIITQQLSIDVFGLGIFTVIASFVCNYIMSEVGTKKRASALGTALLALFAAMVLVALVNRSNVLVMISIVFVFFFAYYARKYSLSLHMIGFVAVAGFYFAWVFNVNNANLAPFFLAIFAAALSNLLFWSVIMPPRPISAIRRAILSLYLRSAAILSNLASDLELGKGSEKNRERARKQLRRLERSMRMVGGILPEVLEMCGLSDRSEVIRTTLFSTSRAIHLISNEGQAIVTQGPMVMGNLNSRLIVSLRAISSWLTEGAPPEDRDRLGSTLREDMGIINSTTIEGEAKGQAGLLRITAELLTLSENASTIRSISDEIRSSSNHQDNTKKMVKTKAKKPPLTQTTRLGGWTVSVPTLMALQALAAGFIALGFGYAVGVSPLYQTFWFALVTVSGSLGETRLKSLSRIIGTAAGIFLGLTVAFLIGDSDFLVVVAVLIAFFLLEFTRTVSLNWFICFLITILVLAMAGAGADPVGFSKSLIASSVIGVGAALLSTNVLFPIKIRNRFFSALSEYLVSMRACLQAYTASPKDGRVGVPRNTLMPQAERYKTLEQISQANLIESNPFSALDRDRSYEMTTILESLNDAVMKLDAGTGTDRTTDSPPPKVINSIIEVIGRNISSIETYLKDPRSVPIIDEGKDVLKDWMENEAGRKESMLNQPYRRDMFPIMDIHDILQVLAKRLAKKI